MTEIEKSHAKVEEEEKIGGLSFSDYLTSCRYVFDKTKKAFELRDAEKVIESIEDVKAVMASMAKDYEFIGDIHGSAKSAMWKVEESKIIYDEYDDELSVMGTGNASEELANKKISGVVDRIQILTDKARKSNDNNKVQILNRYKNLLLSYVKLRSFLNSVRRGPRLRVAVMYNDNVTRDLMLSRMRKEKVAKGELNRGEAYDFCVESAEEQKVISRLIYDLEEGDGEESEYKSGKYTYVMSYSSEARGEKKLVVKKYVKGKKDPNVVEFTSRISYLKYAGRNQVGFTDRPADISVGMSSDGKEAGDMSFEIDGMDNMEGELDFSHTGGRNGKLVRDKYLKYLRMYRVALEAKKSKKTETIRSL
jgi:hypothetical protein